MRPFTFYLHERRHPEPHFDFVRCADEVEAKQHAMMLLERFPEYEAVEIFDGGALRNRIARS